MVWGEPVWRPLNQVTRRVVPTALTSWLVDTASLTQRLRQGCRGGFRVRVLDQGWGRPLRNECGALGMRAHEYGLVRQVHLLCGGRPVVFARTIIPRRTLRGPQRRLAHLGDRPLGAMLFADRTVRRGAMEVARIAAGERLYDVATAGAPQPLGAIWGRRSVFLCGGKPLLVSEIFLAAIARAGSGPG